ncbi:MAG: hypothetical protein EOO38_19440, partial [Cytophagaceae bacterium]
MRPEWNTELYDAIAEYVPNLVPSSGRGSVVAKVALPSGAKNAIAVLAQSGVDFQDNVYDTKAYQYWGDVSENGEFTIPRVKAGTYRLTVYADGIFGDYIQDDIVVTALKKTLVDATWTAESSGTELWRIGIPDKSSGEYRHGYAPSTDHPLLTEEYRLYWAAYDFPTEYPDGVEFKVGRDDESTALNYVHWSVFGGKANYVRPQPVYDNINNWTILFDVEAQQLQNRTTATFTVQLAGAKTAAGRNGGAPSPPAGPRQGRDDQGRWRGRRRDPPDPGEDQPAREPADRSGRVRAGLHAPLGAETRERTLLG